MAHFITSESGTVSRRAGLSFSWIAVALVAVGLLVAAPAQAACASPGNCYGIACNTCDYTGCWTYGGCNMPQKRQEWYCNWEATGCTWSGYRCYECD